jgi:hypothetical protein
MYGGGFGTEVNLSEKMTLNIEDIVHQEVWISEPGGRHFLYIDRLNLYNSARFLFGWRMDERISLHVGPSFNVSVSHSDPDLGVLAWNEIPPYSIFNRTSSRFRETNVQMWFGVQGGIRF